MCGAHRDAPAVATCLRCGRFLCDACVVIQKEETYCVDCVHTLSREGPSRLAKVAIGLTAAAYGIGAVPFALVTLFDAPLSAMALAVLMPPAAIAAIVVASIERGRIRRMESPIRGRHLALAARVLSALLLFAVVALLLSMHLHR
jgi:hypothetical protein